MEERTENDHTLVNAYKAGDIKAFELLYLKYTNKMKGVAYRYVGNSAEAEDIIQEVFINVFKKISSLKNPASFEAWLKRSVINTSINYLSSQKKENKKNQQFQYLLQQEEEEYEPIEDADYSTEELLALIDELPDGYKLVFNMYIVDSYSHKEIAEILNISEGTSKSQLFKAREFLKKRIRTTKNFMI